MHDPTVTDLVFAGLARNTTGVCLATRRGEHWHETSCEAFEERVRRLALGLADLGIQKGDRVALHMENSATWVMADLALLSLGAVTVPLYTTLPGEQIRYILEDAGARAYLVSTEALFAPVAEHLRGLAPAPLLIGAEGAFTPEMLPLDAVLARGRALDEAAPDRFEALRAAVKPDDLASLVYTSGTTGQPKGVMLTHRNFASNLTAALTRTPFDVERHRGGRILSYLPLSHVLERLGTFLYLHIGYPIYFVEDPKAFLEDCQYVRPVFFSTVPRLLEKIYAGLHAHAAAATGPAGLLLRWALGVAATYDARHPERRRTLRFRLADRLVFARIRERFGGRLRAIISGGAALPPHVMNFFNALGIFCGQGYGLTETSPIVTLCERGALRPGSVGRPLPGVSVRLDDDGEILVRGPNVMKGYFNLPDATAAVFTGDGWFRTGDIGRLDDDGFLYITDRKKELLKLATGKYIAPQPIEMRLMASPYIEQAVVLGDGRPFCTALLVVDHDAVARALGPAPTEADVEALLAAEVEAVNAPLPPWERVKRFALLDRPFTIEGGELTPTLKIKRRVVQARCQRQIAQLYAPPATAPHPTS